MLLISSFQPKTKWASLLLWVALCIATCQLPPPQAPTFTFHQDSLQVVKLVDIGDSLYAIRSGMSTIENSMLCFDSANRMAHCLGDTALLARTLYFIGNVYNAWNKEPQNYHRLLPAINSYTPEAGVF